MNLFNTGGKICYSEEHGPSRQTSNQLRPGTDATLVIPKLPKTQPGRDRGLPQL